MSGDDDRRFGDIGEGDAQPPAVVSRVIELVIQLIVLAVVLYAFAAIVASLVGVSLPV